MNFANVDQVLQHCRMVLMLTCIVYYAAIMQRLWSVRPLWWEFRTTAAQSPPSNRWRSTTTGTSPAGKRPLICQAILPCHSPDSHPRVTTPALCQITTLRQWTPPEWTPPVHHCIVVLITVGPRRISTAVLSSTALRLNSVPQTSMMVSALHPTVTTVLHLDMVMLRTNLLCHTSAWVSCAAPIFPSR